LKTKLKCIGFLFIWSSSVFADIIQFKNGKSLENVKCKISRESVLVQLMDGKKETYSKSMIKSIRLRPVILNPPRTDAEKIEYEKEKIRVAEALLDVGDWEPSAEDKLRLAVLNLKAGKGVEDEEVETIAELIATNLVKTKLFFVIDRVSIGKAISEKAGSSCKTEKDCDPNSIASFINASKVLTGTVTKVKGKYFINGNIVNAKSNSIDFAETAIADSPSKFPDAAEYFAKKVAGGIMEIYDTNIIIRDRFSNLPYLTRSLLLPGLGQYKAGVDNKNNFQKWKGYVFGGVFFLATVNFYLKYKDFNEKKDSYDSIHSLFLVLPSRSVADQIFYIQDRNAYYAYKDSGVDVGKAILFLGFVYVLNVVDSLFPDKKFLGFGKINRESGAGLELNIKRGYPMLSENGQKNDLIKKEFVYEINYSFRF
jgi:TolB-like protein